MDAGVQVPLLTMKCYHLCLRMEVYTLPRQEVRAMGLKLVGDEGLAVLLASQGAG